MMQAAANGQASDVSEILDEMQEDGLEPGPYAYHALVFAHVKKKNSDEALAVMKLMHKLGMYNHRADSQFSAIVFWSVAPANTEQHGMWCCAGLQAVAQSYCAVMYSFVSDGQVDLAMRVFASMRASGISAYPGWLTITNQLYNAAQQDLADQIFLNRQPDWQPDADLYVHIIKSACSASVDKPAIYIATSTDPAPSTESSEAAVDQLGDALKILQEMKVNGSGQSTHTCCFLTI